MSIFINMLSGAWDLLLESSVYILFGLLVSGLLRVFLSPNAVIQHLGSHRFKSVFKAALLGIPIPLCSCGVLPAAVSLKKQGANNGATTAFLISTPESGPDSIAITYALLDPIMTIIRPVAAFVTAAAAGILENSFTGKNEAQIQPDLTCPVDACCDGQNCPPEEHKRHHSLWEKISAGIRYAFTDVWADMAGWFFIGLILAGLIHTIIPDAMLREYMGEGLSAMVLMLIMGIPLYICATASTPIAAAMILKGVSPGAVLVFLMAGPATNMAGLTVLTGILGKRATAIYLSAIVVFSLAFGLLTDYIYAFFGVSAQALVGQAEELVPVYIQWAGAIFLLLLSIKPITSFILRRFKPHHHEDVHHHHCHTPSESSNCFHSK